ncbi:MAG: aminopeptidase [Pseudomonadota bacterium]
MLLSLCLRVTGLLLLSASLSGCYYLQAAGGQLSVMNKRVPIDEVIEDSATPAELARRLALIRDAREFASAALALPDNKSYRSFSDLERDYVVWNVVEAPEFSVESQTWCFPVAGCVGYRGYFNKAAAERKARKLARQGNDVFVAGVAAYSTLGRFSDPVLSTMLRWEDDRIVAVLFHELAHQVLYVKNDTPFNESFASAVEEFGIEQWLRQRGESDQFAAWQRRRTLQQSMTGLVLAAREELSVVYASGVNEDAMRERKLRILDKLGADFDALFDEYGVVAPEWRSQPLNNARLAVWSAYESHVPAFRSLFESCERQFECFYAAARELSELDEAERTSRLEALGGGEV